MRGYAVEKALLAVLVAIIFVVAWSLGGDRPVNTRGQVENPIDHYTQWYETSTGPVECIVILGTGIECRWDS